MLSLSRAYFWIFIYMLLAQILAPALFKSADELGVLFMAMLIALDLAINRDFKRYLGLFGVVAVMTVYAVYSIVVLDFNTPKAILLDFVIELKPFVAFFIGYSIKPQFKPWELQVLKGTTRAIIVLLILLFVTSTVEDVLFHVAYFGSVAFTCFLIHLLASVRRDGTIARSDIYCALGILAVGLLCTRSKYYGEVVISLFMLLIYKPGMFRKISAKQVGIVVAVIVAVLIVSWSKINYYFLTGNGDTFDADTAQTFARPALLLGMFMILCDYPLLGSGLASYATYASTPSVNYSAVYAQYDLNKVFGLSEQYPNFICDTFYASFAQFGLIGIALFIYFFVWVFQKLRLVLHRENRYYFMVGVLTIVTIMIENVGGTFFTQAGGLITMLLLGQIVAPFRNISTEERKAALTGLYEQGCHRQELKVQPKEITNKTT